MLYDSSYAYEFIIDNIFEDAPDVLDWYHNKVEPVYGYEFLKCKGVMVDDNEGLMLMYEGYDDTDPTGQYGGSHHSFEIPLHLICDDVARKICQAKVKHKKRQQEEYLENKIKTEKAEAEQKERDLLKSLKEKYE
jgi:hypothetical protein